MVGRTLRIAMLGALGMQLAACATDPSKIRSTYTSSAPYEHLSCERLNAEHDSLGAAIEGATADQQGLSNHDAVMAAAALFVWPAVFGIGSAGDRASDLSRLKGERDAVYRAGSDKDCFVGVPEKG